MTEYDEPLPLPPVVDALRLTLGEPVESLHTESLDRPGERAFVHHVHDESGARVASLKLVPRGDDTLHVAWIGRPPGSLGQDANTLGPAHVREIARIVKRAYPGRSKVTGHRVSGFRSDRGFHGEAANTAVKLSRVGRWLRGLIDAFRDELHESLGRAGMTPSEAKAHRAKIVARVKAGELKREQARAEAERVYAAQKEREKAHVAASVKAHADKHHEAFAKAFGITNREAAHAKLTKLLHRAVAAAPVDREKTTFTVRKRGLPVSGGPLGDRTGKLTISRKLARPSALLKTAPSDLWALLERIHAHHETKLTPDVALNGALADMIDELNGTGHEDPRSTVVRGAGRLDAFGGVYHPSLSGVIYHYPNAVEDVVRPFASGGSDMSLGFTTKNRSAMARGGHVRVPTVQWNVKTPAKAHADKTPRDLVFFKPFLTPEGEPDVHGLHELIDRLPKRARASWRKAAEENGHPDPREKPVKLMGGFAGGTNTDVPNLVKKPAVKLAKINTASFAALRRAIRENVDARGPRLMAGDELQAAGVSGAHVVANAELIPAIHMPAARYFASQHGYSGELTTSQVVSLHPTIDHEGEYRVSDTGFRVGHNGIEPKPTDRLVKRGFWGLASHRPAEGGATPSGGDPRALQSFLEHQDYAPAAQIVLPQGKPVGAHLGVFHTDEGGRLGSVAHVRSAEQLEHLISDFPQAAQEYIREVVRRHAEERGSPWPKVKKPRKKKLARQRFAGEGSSVVMANSANHESRLKVAKQILSDSGFSTADVRAAILHAAGSTRPALAAVISQAAHPDHVKYTAAWLGLATQQPGVAVATVDPAGRDRLHVLHVGGGHEGMTGALKRAGVEKFTVESGKAGGHRIWVLNPDGKYPVAQLAKVNNARHSSIRVSVTRLGSGSSADAAGGSAGSADSRAAYREAIDAFERAGA